jgi:hypothetical protein
MGSIADGGHPVSLLKNAGQLAEGGLAAIAVMLKTETGPIMQVAAIGGGVVAILLEGFPRCGGLVPPLATATISAALAATTTSCYCHGGYHHCRPAAEIGQVTASWGNLSSPR